MSKRLLIKKTFFRVNLVLNLSCAFLLLLMYASVYIKPSAFWFAGFLGLAYPYIFFLNLLYVLYWMIRRKKLFLISLILLLLGWKHIGSIFRISFSEDSYQSKTDISVLSYNIRLRKLYNHKNQLDKTVINLINTVDPDIICLQESYVKYGQPLHIPLALQHKFEFKNCVVQRGNSVTNYGMTLLSKFPLINKGEIRFDNTLNFCLYGDYIIKKDTVRIYNVHLQSIKFARNDFKMIDSIARFENQNRIKHIKTISEKLIIAFQKRSDQVDILKNHINNSPYKVIVCGDFNDTPVSNAYHRMSKNLVDTYREKGKGIGNTYISKKLAYRIDYILHDDRFETVWYKKTKIVASDHYPVMAGIRLK